MAQPNTFYDIEDYFSEEDSLQGSQLPPRSPDPPGDSDVGDSQLSDDPNNPEWYYTEGIVRNPVVTSIMHLRRKLKKTLTP